MGLKRILVLAVIGFCMFFCGCAGEEQEKVEITFIHGWGSTEKDHIAMRKIYMDFEKENPEIKLNMISMPSSKEVLSKVGDLLTVGEVPDIIFTAGEGKETVYGFMAEKGYALDLMPILKSDKELEESISLNAMEHWITEDNRLYTVSDVLLLSGGYWYNKELFRQAGIEKPSLEREQWIQDCEKIYEYSFNNKRNIQPMLLDSNHVIYLMDAILADEYPAILAKKGKKEINLLSPGFQKTLNRLISLSKIADVVNSFNYRDTLASFNAGETAMYVNGVWASSMIDEKLDIGYMPFPTEDGKGVSAVSTGVGYILGNTGDEKKMQASVEFLKYMLSQSVAKRILTETGQIPSNPQVEITEELAGSRLYQAVESLQGAETIIEVPTNIWGSNRQEEYGDSIIMYLDERVTFEELQRRMGAE